MNNFQQRREVDCMISDFTVCTVYLPIVKNFFSKCHIDTTCLEQGKILQIGFTAHFGHVIHCKAVCLPILKEEQGIPEPYYLFDSPYKLQLQVSFQERDIVLQIISFDELEGSQFNLICLN